MSFHDPPCGIEVIRSKLILWVSEAQWLPMFLQSALRIRCNSLQWAPTYRTGASESLRWHFVKIGDSIGNRSIRRQVEP